MNSKTSKNFAARRLCVEKINAKGDALGEEGL
jgi:hypothetical protein